MNNFFTRTQKHGNTVFTFSSPVRVLSTSPLNGGITEHLSHIVNINCMNGSYECRMLGNTYEEDLAEHVRSLGIAPSCATALSTAAWTELAATEEVTGMAMGVATALDALKWPEILGCIAGDDTIMCACKSSELAEGVMEKLGSILNRR